MAAVTVGVRVKDLSIDRGSRRVVRGVSFEVASGELVALRGTSGSGKTTILRAVAGLDPVAEGEISVGSLRLVPGLSLTGEARRAWYRQVGIVFQFHNLFAHLSALENVCLAPVHVLGQSRAEAEVAARGLLDAVGVAHRAGALPHELSGGEAQRVAIARALAVRPPVLLMDEPTASLDGDRRAALAQILRSLTAAGQTVIVATHDAEFVHLASDRCLTLEDGAIAGAAGR